MLCFGVIPRKIKPLRPTGHFWLIVILGFGLSALVQRWQLRSQPVAYSTAGMLGDAFTALLLLGAVFLVLSRKPVFAFSLTSMLLVAQWVIGFSFVFLADWLNQSSKNPLNIQFLWFGYVLWCLFVGYHGLRFVGAGRTGMQCVGLSLLLSALTLWPTIGPLEIRAPRYVELDRAMLYAEEAILPEPIPAFEPEAVMYAQRTMVEASLAKLKPQRPGVPELFALTLAGDGGENTFLNEAVYAQALFERRFGAQGHTQILVNHPLTTARYPLASLTNLRATLKGMARKMNLEEDILFLFLSSHGSPTHEFALQLPPIPLNQITPNRLSRALSDAGINRRVVVVSACYSGGYLDALIAPQAIVMTAARRDRASFGCGGDADMTYFGRAYLLEALNQHKDVLKAFQSAEQSIAKRELREGQVPSEPQIRIGAQASSMLAAWKRGFEVGEAVPFFAADANALSSQDLK
jgi:hypothetical protein